MAQRVTTEPFHVTRMTGQVIDARIDDAHTICHQRGQVCRNSRRPLPRLLGIQPLRRGQYPAQRLYQQVSETQATPGCFSIGLTQQFVRQIDGGFHGLIFGRSADMDREFHHPRSAMVTILAPRKRPDKVSKSLMAFIPGLRPGAPSIKKRGGTPRLQSAHHQFVFSTY